MAYLRVGQAREMRGELLEAMQNYTISGRIAPDSDGAKATARLWGELNITPLDRSDADLSVFFGVEESLTVPDALGPALAAARGHLVGLDRVELFQKFDAAGVSRLFYGGIQFYYRSDRAELISLCLNCLACLASRGASDVWRGYELLQLVAAHFSTNFDVFVHLLHVLQFAPSMLFEYMAKVDFVGPLCDSLAFEYDDTNLQTVFYLLFQVSNSLEDIARIAERGVADICMRRRTTGSFLLLSKLSLATLAFEFEGALEWALSVLAG